MRTLAACVVVLGVVALAANAMHAIGSIARPPVSPVSAEECGARAVRISRP